MKGTTEIQELKYGWNEIADESEKYTKTVGGMSTDENKLNTGGALNFYVELMTTTAKSVVFNLKYYREDIYEKENKEKTEIYDLLGRKVKNPSKHGVYILGNKKVLR